MTVEIKRQRQRGLVVVFVDTDVLSIFAKIQRIPLLFTVFNEDHLNISTKEGHH